MINFEKAKIREQSASIPGINSLANLLLEIKNRASVFELGGAGPVSESRYFKEKAALKTRVSFRKFAQFTHILMC